MQKRKRSHIRERQREGIAAAKARGVRFGPAPRELDAEIFAACSRAYAAGKITAVEAGKRLNVNYKTFQRRFNELTSENDILSKDRNIV